MKSFGISSLFLLGFVLFETAVLSNIVILPVVPDLVLICSLYFSLQNGRLFGVASGFTGGLFLDFVSACPFGFNCLLRTIIGYVAGFFTKTLNISGVIFPFLLGAIGTLLKAFVLWIISFFYLNISLTYNILSLNFLYQLLFNAVLTPLIFRFLDIFKNSLLLRPEKVS